MSRSTRQQGFSLLELIVVIVLLGVMAAGAGLLITAPLEAYHDQLRRQQLVDQAEMAMRQIARDVRRALPNSLRVVDPLGSGWALEMVNSIDGARYRDEVGTGFTNDVDWLDFASGDSEFNFLGQLSFLSAGPVAVPLAVKQRIVIYNTAAANIYGDAEFDNNPGVITPSDYSLTLKLNDPMPPAAVGAEYHIEIIPPPGDPEFQFAQRSPGQRAFIVDGPISYICDPATRRITRYAGYSYLNIQPVGTPAGANSGAVVTQLQGCTISYDAGTTQRGGILTLGITLDDNSGESVTLLHQVHVDNVP